MDSSHEALSAAGIQSLIQNNARNRVKKDAYERKRNILYLISAYLRENNLITTADCLCSEAQLSNEFEVCDNIDLDTILQEYHSYYFAKFGKQPKCVRTSKQPVSNVQNPRDPHKRKTNLTFVGKQQEVTILNNLNNLEIDVRGLNAGDPATASAGDDQKHKPSLCDFDNYSTEWREMAELIEKEVVPKDLGINWDDCVGLDKVKDILKEAVSYPVLYPQVFSGLTAPWKGVLLYGPPGTGKTLVSKAVACETNSKFFNVTTSCFVNKWRGESEKMIKVLFDLARLYSPSIIFIDEVDALACNHSDFQHDASRRFKSELLVQLDGILTEGSNIFMLAATNKPWDIDSAILRRFEKRMFVELPFENARVQIFKYYWWLAKKKFSESEYKEMGSLSQNFSGSDIKGACREASMITVREAFDRNIPYQKNLLVRNPVLTDVLAAIRAIKSVTNTQMHQRYQNWKEEFGCE